jgi:hypothetical protein
LTTKENQPVTIRKYFKASILGIVIFAIPAIIFMMVINLLNSNILIIISLITLIEFPITSIIMWLIAKGSNWQNTKIGLITAFIFPSRIYSILVGGLVGFRIAGLVGGILGSIILFFLIRIIIIKFSRDYLYKHIN